MPPPAKPEDLAALLNASRALLQEMQALGMQLRRLAALHSALAKRHSTLIEAMRGLKAKRPRG